MNLENLKEDIEDAKTMLNDVESVLLINNLELLVRKQELNLEGNLSDEMLIKYMDSFKNSFHYYPFPNCIYPNYGE